NVLIAGPSGSGKSTLTAGLVERLIGKDYQVCIVDPEGDYAAQRDVVALGNPARAPSVSEILAILEDPAINLSIKLLGIPLHDRPEFFAQLIPNLQAMRAHRAPALAGPRRGAPHAARYLGSRGIGAAAPARRNHPGHGASRSRGAGGAVAD